MKKIMMLCITTMILSLVGCGKAATDATVISEENTGVQDKVVIGKVTAIDGTTLTVAEGEMELAERGIKSEEKPPENLKPDGEAQQRMRPKDKVSEYGKPDVPEQEELFKEDGKTIQLTLSDDTAIEIETNGMTENGSITDIKEGSLISIVYDTKGEVTTVQVMGEHGFPKPPTEK